VLRSLTRAVYGPQEEGHYALASDRYCHFTSPIRRYPDLTVHRALDMIAAGRRPPAEGLPQLGEQCSDLERRAEAAERELVKLKLLLFLASRRGLELDAVVTGVEAFGIFVQGVELPAEGLVPLESLPEDSYSHDRTAHRLSGRRAGQTFRLGDRMRVAVDRVDLERRTLEFRIAGPGAGHPRRSGRRKASGPKKAGRSRREGSPRRPSTRPGGRRSG